jgi:hypothetical protein
VCQALSVQWMCQYWMVNARGCENPVQPEQPFPKQSRTKKVSQTMVDPDALMQSWHEISAKLRQHWTALTNEDLQSFNGDVNQLVELIQHKTGDVRLIVERYLEELTVNAAAMLERTAKDVRDYTHESEERIEDGARQVAEAWQQGRETVAAYTRQNPAASLALWFGAGLVAGVVVGLSVRRR